MNDPFVMFHKPSESIFMFVPASCDYAEAIYLTFQPKQDDEVLLTVFKTPVQDSYITRLRFPFAEEPDGLFVLYAIDSHGNSSEVKKYDPVDHATSPTGYRGIVLIRSELGGEFSLNPFPIGFGKDLTEFRRICWRLATSKRVDTILSYAMAFDSNANESLADLELIIPNSGRDKYSLFVDIRVGEDEQQFTAEQSASTLQALLLSEPKPVINIGCGLPVKQKAADPDKQYSDIDGRLLVYYISLKSARLYSLVKTQPANPNENLEFLFGLIRPNSSVAPFPLRNEVVQIHRLIPNSPSAEFEFRDPFLGDLVVLAHDPNVIDKPQIKIEGIDHNDASVTNQPTNSQQHLKAENLSWFVFLRSGVIPLDHSDLAALESAHDGQYGLAHYKKLIIDNSNMSFSDTTSDYSTKAVNNRIEIACSVNFVKDVWTITEEFYTFETFEPLFLSTLFRFNEKLANTSSGAIYDNVVELSIDSQSLLDSVQSKWLDLDQLDAHQLFLIKSEYGLLKKMALTKLFEGVSGIAALSIEAQVNWILSR